MALSWLLPCAARARRRPTVRAEVDVSLLSGAGRPPAPVMQCSPPATIMRCSDVVSTELGGEPAAARKNSSAGLEKRSRKKWGAVRLAHAHGMMRQVQYNDAGSVFDLLEAAPGGLAPDVRLLDSNWLLARAAQLEAATSDAERRRLALPHRRQLEERCPEAFLDVEVLRDELPRGTHGELAAGSVSHVWLTPSHPDPEGSALVAIARAVRRAQRGEMPSQQVGWDGKGAKGYQRLPHRFGVFHAWASLYQQQLDDSGEVESPRTAAEERCFASAMEHAQLWYVHQLLFVLLLAAGDLPNASTLETRPPLEEGGQPQIDGPVSSSSSSSSTGGGGMMEYSNRGWCFSEHAWTMIVKPNSQLCWPMILHVRADGTGRSATRQPPMHPDRFERALATAQFSIAADRALVLRLHREAYLSIFASQTFLNYKRCEWGEPEFCQLAEVLRLCTSCLKINLGDNGCGDQGAEAIAIAAVDGALPSLEALGLYRNRLGVAAFLALARAVSAGAMPSLRLLCVDGNPAATAWESMMTSATPAAATNPSSATAALAASQEVQGAVGALQRACAARSIQLSLTASEREKLWRGDRLVPKGLGDTSHMQYLASPNARLRGIVDAVLAANRIDRLTSSLTSKVAAARTSRQSSRRRSEAT